MKLYTLDPEEPSKDQEIVATHGGAYEGAATFTGTYDGHHVSGRTYVEMLGNLKS